jgi:hypothetical protein
MRDNVLTATSVNKVAELLASTRVAWILKEENTRLSKLGYTSKRPDPDAAYIAAGIQIWSPETVDE